MTSAGEFVDNAHHGGIFANINIATGQINSDGFDVYGNNYEIHPITNFKIKDNYIPNWDDIVALSVELSLADYRIRFAGWDFAVLADNSVELIEGNHAPDFDVMQGPMRHGLKKKVNSTLINLGIR